MLSSFRVMFWSSCFCGSLQCKPFVDPTVCVCPLFKSLFKPLCLFRACMLCLSITCPPEGPNCLPYALVGHTLTPPLATV